MIYTVFYMNCKATQEVCQIIRQQMPPGWVLTTPTEGEDYSAPLSECDFILVAEEVVSAEHIAAAPRLRMIQNQGVGYERIDLNACRERGIFVALTPEGTSGSVAEFTILLILASYRHLIQAAIGVWKGRWMRWELRKTSFDLNAKTLGLVGFGKIGREVAKRAQAFGCRIIYYDPWAPPPTDYAVDRKDSLEALLGEADIVSLHVPLTAANHHLINARTLKLMKPGAILINTARGKLVDEAALFESLTAGQLAGAALDVLEEEPPDPSNRLLHLENVLITPHFAAGTRDALTTKMKAAFANMLRFSRGEALLNVVPELSQLTGENHATQP